MIETMNPTQRVPPSNSFVLEDPELQVIATEITNIFVERLGPQSTGAAYLQLWEEKPQALRYVSPVIVLNAERNAQSKKGLFKSSEQIQRFHTSCIPVVKSMLVGELQKNKRTALIRFRSRGEHYAARISSIAQKQEIEITHHDLPTLYSVHLSIEIKEQPYFSFSEHIDGGELAAFSISSEDLSAYITEKC